METVFFHPDDNSMYSVLEEHTRKTRTDLLLVSNKFNQPEDLALLTTMFGNDPRGFGDALSLVKNMRELNYFGMYFDGWCQIKLSLIFCC